MIDKLSLTTYIPPDKEYLEAHGKITEDKFRIKFYRFICELDKVVIFFCPHQFSEKRNAGIPFTKIDLNPKNFESYEHMLSYLSAIFGDSDINLEEFNISRIDIAVDLEDFSIDHVISSINVKNIHSESFNIFKKTIYAGSNPKIRIYNKIKEIKTRMKKSSITDYEKQMIDSDKDYTRFEIQIRHVGVSLKELSDNPGSFASYFDRLEFFEFKERCTCTLMQFMYKQVNRKFRKDLERFKNMAIVEELKQRYVVSVREWFNPDSEPF